MSGHLPQVVATACSGRLDDLAVGELQDLAAGLRTAVQRLTGKLDEVLGELEARSGGQVRENPGSDGPALWMSTRTWWRESSVLSGGQAGRDLRRAAVATRLPVLRDAVTDGRLSPAQAAVLYRLDGRIPAAELEASQEALVAVAAPMDPEALAQWVRHLVATHCEPAFEEDDRRAQERRYLQVTRNPDGTTSGRFVLADGDAEVVLTVLEPLARRQGLQDERTAGQRRADALVEVCAGALQGMDLPQAGGRRPQLVYVMPSGWACGDAGPSLLELLEAGLVVPDSPAGLDAAPPHPAVFEQHVATAPWTGPQTRARLATTLCDADLSRAFRDSIGQVHDLQSLTGEITPAQRRALVARDHHCVERGCTRPPAFCDAHHLTSRADGGATTLDNLVLLCRRHHVQWHRGKVRLDQLPAPRALAQQTAGDPPATGAGPPRLSRECGRRGLRLCRGGSRSCQPVP